MGSGSVEIITDPDLRGSKTYGSGSGTLPQRFVMYTVRYFTKKVTDKKKQIKKVRIHKKDMHEIFSVLLL
jgi:hypothetical protein